MSSTTELEQSQAQASHTPARLRRRTGAGCVHPVYVKGQVTAWRGLASYKDPETGKQRRRSVTRKTRRAAEQALKELLASLPKAVLVSRRRPGTVALPVAHQEGSLLAYLNRWLAHKRRELRPTTYRAYVNELLHLTPELGELPLATLNAMQIQQAITDRLDQGSSTAKCLSTALRTMRMALRQAVLWGVIPSNPASMARAPRTRPKEMTVWNQEETRRFLNHLGSHRLAPLFTLALSTSMRRGEILALAWGDLNLERADLTVTRNYIRCDDQRRAAAIPLSQLLSAKPSEAQPVGQRDELVTQLQQLIAVLLKDH